ncbi:MAG: phosphatidylserine decarboxylase [Armatimonadota bacterium]
MIKVNPKATEVRRPIPGLASEGLPFIAAGLALTGLTALLSRPLAILPLALTGLTTYFFRDPERVTPAEPGCLYAPADGHVMFVEEVEEERFIKGPAYQVAIFLSILDVHINRSPVDGIVRFREYVPGNFRAAWAKESEPGNERQYLGLETAYGPVLVMQVAGLLARRIVCRPQIGDSLAGGERIGLIKFSSRTDLYFPRAHGRPLVTPGMQVYGGVTPIGECS